MKTKEQVIQEAYGNNWDKVKNFIRYEDGSLPTFPFLDDEFGCTDFFYKELGYNRNDINPYVGGDMEASRWRLKSLDGIENNNFWIKINKDFSNLPDKSTHPNVETYKLYTEKEDIISTRNYWAIEFVELFDNENIRKYHSWSHYLIIKPIKKPFY